MHSSAVGSFLGILDQFIGSYHFCIGTSLPFLSSILPFCPLIPFLSETLKSLPELYWCFWMGRNDASSLSACIFARPYPFQLPCNPLGLWLWCSVGETAFRFPGIFEEQCENGFNFVCCKRILDTSTCCLLRLFNFFFVLLH